MGKLSSLQDIEEIIQESIVKDERIDLNSLEHNIIIPISTLAYTLDYTAYKLGLFGKIGTLMLPKLPGDYTTIDIARYIRALGIVEEFLDFQKESIRGREEIVRKIHESIIGQYKSLAHDISKSDARLKIDDTYESFYRRNRGTKFFALANKELISELKNIFEGKRAAEEEYEEKRDIVYDANRNIRDVSNKLKEIRTILGIIEELQSNRPDMPINQVDQYLIAALSGNITISRLKKFLRENKKGESSSVELSKPVYVPSLSGEESLEKRIYDSEELEFLKQRGIKNGEAKVLMDRKDYFSIRSFMESLEETFRKNRIDFAEAVAIYARHPGILTGSRQERHDYIELLGQIFAIHNPKKVSGILPRNNMQLYSSAENMRRYVESRQKNTSKVLIEGLELITNEKDRKVFEGIVTQDPFEYITVSQYRNGVNSRDKDLIYRQCVKLAGEGHYRKAPFGQRRAIFKVTNTEEGSYHVKVIRYDTEYTEFHKWFAKGV